MYTVLLSFDNVFKYHVLGYTLKRDDAIARAEDALHTYFGLHSQVGCAEVIVLDEADYIIYQAMIKG